MVDGVQQADGIEPPGLAAIRAMQITCTGARHMVYRAAVATAVAGNGRFLRPRSG